LFFSGARLWGLINDALIALEAILFAALAWALFPAVQARSTMAALFGLAAAGVGAPVVTVGSYLVISGRTDYVLAAHYMGFGFGLVGVWLLLQNYHFGRAALLPRALIWFGMAAGVLMLAGLVSGYGIVTALGMTDPTPWIVSTAGLVGVLGWMIVGPVWCVWFARNVLSL
jgi:hypothetical protein